MMSADKISIAVEKVLKAETGGDRAKVFAGMDQPMKKAVRAELKRREEEAAAGPAGSEEEEEGIEDIDWSKIGGGVQIPTPKGKGKRKDVNLKIEVTEKELDEVWASIEADDTSEYDPDVAAAFDYQGFSASAVLTQVMVRGKRAGLDRKVILKDISLMCAAAHKKGSINDKNYQKMKKSGQAEYDRLAGIYNLVKGGAKGMSPETLTISRIGPTFSAKITRLILDGKLPGKSFIGPFKSSTLHSVMQSQFFVSVVPSSLPDKSKDFIVGLCRAYSSDQTLALVQGKKPTAEEVWDKQLGFIELTRNSDHPSDEARKAMCSKIPWPEVYEKTASCVAAIKKVDNTFIAPTKTEFLGEISKV
jgi:hypothetical protein